MNKYTLLMVMFVFLVIITLIAQDIELATSENILTGAVSDTGQNSASIFNMIGVLFRVITFQIPAIPLIINLIVFYPLTIGVIAMIVDVLKDLVPFT
jgi:hypothetical protein